MKKLFHSSQTRVLMQMHHLMQVDTIFHKHEEKINGKNKILDPPQEKKKKDNMNALHQYCERPQCRFLKYSQYKK